MKTISLVAVIFLWGTTAFSFSIQKGLGPPDTQGWCPADWLLGCTSGTAALGPQGLFLSNLASPPRSAYELELKLLPYRSLLFNFRADRAVGHLLISLDGVVLERVKAEAGDWWLRLDDVPKEGVLKVELDEYCETIVIRSVYFPCSRAEPCMDRFMDGFLLGIGLTVTFLLITYFLTGLGR